MRYVKIILVVLVCLITSAYATEEPSNNPLPDVSRPAAARALPINPVSASITCREFNQLSARWKQTKDNTVGFAEIWLDGYYSARSEIGELAAGWAKTLSEGLIGTCGIEINANRTVLDVIAQLHRDYGGAAH